jgi:hypothetical protein
MKTTPLICRTGIVQLNRAAAGKMKNGRDFHRGRSSISGMFG